MRAVRHHRHGDPATLVLEEVPEPVPGAGELLVAVEAAGVGLPTVRSVRDGDPAALPAVPGGEVCGTVVATGTGVDEGWRGRRVTGIAFDGAYAERAVLREPLTLPVPDAVSAPDAVALVRGGQVALGALRAGTLDDARSVLVTAAAGGVGHLAVQIAAAAGGRPRVVALVGPDGAGPKTAMLRELGAHEVATYDGEWPAEPVDLAVDAVGGPVQARCLEALAPLGRLVVYGARGGPVDTDALRAGGQAVIGFAMVHVGRDPARYRRRAEELWALHGSGALRPRTRTFPLAEAAGAHRELEGRAGLGKTVLLIGR